MNFTSYSFLNNFEFGNNSFIIHTPFTRLVDFHFKTTNANPKFTVYLFRSTRDYPPFCQITLPAATAGESVAKASLSLPSRCEQRKVVDPMSPRSGH